MTCRRETRALLAAGQDAEARTFIADNTHPRLWRLLAEHALQQLDLETAEKGFVHCRDMQGLQLVQHLGMLGDKDKQQAEVGCMRFPMPSSRSSGLAARGVGNRQWPT